MDSSTDPSNSAPTSATASPRRRGRIGHWFLICLAAMAVVIAVELGRMFFLVREARDIQISIANSTHWQTDTKAQLSVGPLVFGLSQFAVRWIDEMPAEAKVALAAMQEASVGVYELRRDPSDDERLAMIAATRERMAGRGWKNLVTVNDGDDTVIVFTTDELGRNDTVRVCVAVCSGRDLVVVSARAEAGPLLEMARTHSGQWGADRFKI